MPEAPSNAISTLFVLVGLSTLTALSILAGLMVATANL